MLIIIPKTGLSSNKIAQGLNPPPPRYKTVTHRFEIIKWWKYPSLLDLGFDEKWSGDNTCFNLEKNQGNLTIQTSGLQFVGKFENSIVKETKQNFQWPK